MSGLLRSLARALAGMLHPRVWWLTAAPFIMSALLWGLLFWYGWEGAVAQIQHWLGQWPALGAIESAIAFIGLSGLHVVFAPFLVVALAIPLIIATILVVIGATSMPSIVSHLGRRRYAALTPRHGGGLVGSVVHSVAVTAVFLVLMVLSAPLWLIPPFFAILPPVLWGWLTYRVMSYDALAEHATPDERRRLMRQHRWPLVAIGIVTGLLGAVPAMVWASSLIAIVLFPIVAVISIWLYVLIFVFSGLWFTHYCLDALSVMRAHDAAPAPL
ncbi:MAG: EI24 domain-containing protein [Janthinobacterium lividum]